MSRLSPGRGIPRERLLWIVAMAGLQLGMPAVVFGQELEPRAFAHLPVGLNFAAFGYGYTGGGVAVDPTVPLEDVKISAQIWVAGWARTLDVFGRSSRVDIVVPTVSLSGSALSNGERLERDVSGFADPTVRFSIGLLGSPSLSLKEFAGHKSEFTVGASLRVGIPLGQYDEERLVNIGTNRWTFKPEIGLSRTFGRWTLEAAGGVTFFSTNPDFFGDSSRSQDPLYSIQGHVVYSLSRGAWLALDATFYGGGRSTLDGVEKDDRQANSRIGATLVLPISKNHSLKIYGSVGATVRIGNRFEMIGLLWQYRWGGGL